MKPLLKTVTVPLTPDAAFTLFTKGIDTWWPAHLRKSKTGASRLTVDPKHGGTITERSADGQEHRWGRITKWQAGEALAIDWTRDLAEGRSTVEVTFTPTDDGTRVDLTHTAANCNCATPPLCMAA